VFLCDGVLLGLFFFVYVFLSICLLNAYYISDWSVRPHLPILQSHCTGQDSQTQDSPTMQEWVADEYLRSIESNKPRIEQKAQWCNKALMALAIEAGLIVITGFVTILIK
jgi:hypothetical protein